MSENNLGNKNTGLPRLAGTCGILASVLPLVMILSATVFSPWFRWDTNALSDLGVRDEAWLFNSAVVIGGILNIFFVIGLLQNLNQKKLTRVGIALIMIASVCLCLVGIFTLDSLFMHSVVALGYFIFAPSGFLLVGFAAEGNIIRRLSIISGITGLFAIFVLPLVISALSFKVGFALSELAESLIISNWTILLSAKLIGIFR